MEFGLILKKTTSQKYNQPEESALRENVKIWQRNKQIEAQLYWRVGQL